MPITHDLSGRVAIVTGGSNGIGRSIAERAGTHAFAERCVKGRVTGGRHGPLSVRRNLSRECHGQMEAPCLSAPVLMAILPGEVSRGGE